VAARDWSNLSNEPERKLARRLAEKLGIKPPIDVRKLIENYADIEEITEPIPGSVDAIVIRRAQARPRVIISSIKTSQQRCRFTLAHELGHIIIPWQLGTVFCHAALDYSVISGDEDFLSIEGEASRFASELLLPTPWVSEFIGSRSSTLATAITEMAELADVSLPATTIAVSGVCPPGVLLLILKDGCVDFACASTGTYCVTPKKGTIFSYNPYKKLEYSLNEQTFRNRKIAAIRFSRSTLIDDETRGRIQQHSSDILMMIMAEVNIPEGNRPGIRQSIAGIIGSVYSSQPKSDRNSSMILPRLRQRFHETILFGITKHPQFDIFLIARALELCERRV
jgi:hypothetical protein